MALKDTIKSLRGLLDQITADLPKAENGNKAASQRVRTGTVRLEKVAKLYRKESIKHEKSTKGTKRKAAAPKKAAAKKHAPATAAKKGKASHAAAKKPAAKKSVKKSSAHKSFSKSKSRHTSAHPSALSVRRAHGKRPTAKLSRKPAR